MNNQQGTSSPTVRGPYPLQFLLHFIGGLLLPFLIAEHREVSRQRLERRFFLNIVCIKVIAEETLNKFQAELLEKPGLPVGEIEFLCGPSIELSDCSASYSERAILFKAVPHSYHFPPGRGLVVGVGFWIWLLEEGIPVDDGQRLFRITLEGSHRRSMLATVGVSEDCERRVKPTSRLQGPPLYVPSREPRRRLMMEPPVCCTGLGM